MVWYSKSFKTTETHEPYYSSVGHHTNECISVEYLTKFIHRHSTWCKTMEFRNKEVAIVQLRRRARAESSHSHWILLLKRGSDLQAILLEVIFLQIFYLSTINSKFSPHKIRHWLSVTRILHHLAKLKMIW